jgi:phospholipid transport system transporter-binding protein
MASIRREGNVLKVDGPIHMANARALMGEGAALLSPEVASVDMDGVTEVDSAAVSLLLEWQRQMAKHKVTLRFANLPESVKSLATLYGVTTLLPQ